MKLVFACLGLALVPLASLRSSTLSPLAVSSAPICDRCMYGHEGCTEHPKAGSVVAPQSAETHRFAHQSHQELAERMKAHAELLAKDAQRFRRSAERDRAAAIELAGVAMEKAHAAHDAPAAHAAHGSQALSSRQAELEVLRDKLAQLEQAIAGESQNAGHSCHCGHTCCGTGQSSNSFAPAPPQLAHGSLFAAPVWPGKGKRLKAVTGFKLDRSPGGDWVVAPSAPPDANCDDSDEALESDEDCEQDCQGAAECDEDEAMDAEESEAAEEGEAAKEVEEAEEMDELQEPGDAQAWLLLNGGLQSATDLGNLGSRLQVSAEASRADSSLPWALISRSQPHGEGTAELRDLVREMRDEIQALRGALRELRQDVHVSRDEMLR